MTTVRKKIAYISGTRADFGLMTPVLQAIEKGDKLSLQVYAAGMHLMPDFGETVREVERLFPDAKRIDARFEGDDRASMAVFSGKLLTLVVNIFIADRPDVVLILGDRVEMLTVALACTYLGIPTAHLHGGEKTGTVDDIARHAISRMASLHLPATADSANRLKRMGEEEWRIHIVGAPALDTIRNEILPTREALFRKMGLDQSRPFILVVQHAVSEESDDAGTQMEETMKAVTSFNLPVVAVYPNADPGGRKIIAVLEKERSNPLFSLWKNLPHTDFLALEREAAVWVGNSSGALIESSSFGTPVVNIGTRQTGRARGANVIDVGYSSDDIRRAVETSLSDPAYRAGLKTTVNPWGDGHTGEKVASLLAHLEVTPRLLAKQITL